jgi:hypothetical protein
VDPQDDRRLIEEIAKNRLSGLGNRLTQNITHALVREWSSDVAISQRGQFVDFRVATKGLFGLPQNQRLRLYKNPPTQADIRLLVEEADAVQLHPIAVAPMGMAEGQATLDDVAVIGPVEFCRLCEESGIIVRSQGAYDVDKAALTELKDQNDASLALLNGLLWLRPLSRDRKPPALRWTATPAHELFERCFFLTMISTFGADGASWGTRDRGKAAPDGGLRLAQHIGPVLYDCKASRDGYEMSFKDLRTAADYLRNPPDDSWRPRGTERPWFLVVSSEIVGGTRDASFSGRQRQLRERVPNAGLTWIRTPDLCRFGLAIEKSSLTSDCRRHIRWDQILSAGDVRWNVFEQELDHLRAIGCMPGAGS